MKRFFLFFLLVLGFGFAKAQGQYSYKPVNFSVTLPIDTGISGPLERSKAYTALSEFDRSFVYNLNYVRQHPAEFRKIALEPYLIAYPVLQPTYGTSLLADLKDASPVGALLVDSRLVIIARAHAQDVAKHNMMSHRSSTGETTQERFAKAGMPCGSECINMSSYVSSLEVLLSLLIDYNVPNLGHRKSLLNPKMTSVGVGVAGSADGKIQYTVIDLGCN